MLFDTTTSGYDFRTMVIKFLIMMFVFFVSLSLHEFAHAYMAYKMGDDTAKSMGRLTLNPLAHIDPYGLICFIVLRIGWAKPVPINPLKFKKFRTGIRLVSIAGVVMNFILGLLASVLLLILRKCGLGAYDWFVYIDLLLECFASVNGMLFMFNIIPLFPLDGFNFLTSFFKTENAYVRYNYKYGNITLIGILLVSMMLGRMGYDIFSLYINLINRFIYNPIILWG